MPKVATAFFAVGTLFILAGMCLGEYMGATENFVLAPVHAHINLLGWATMALYGTFYALTKDRYSPRLAWANFILSTTGVVVMVLALAELFDTGNHATFGPVLGFAGGLALAGLLVFLVSVFRELLRPA